MKKILTTLFLALVAIVGVQAMSVSSIRTHARFISDRMAYELDLAPWQYEECYEINYDFVYSINRIMDDVVFGYYDAVDAYYRMLDERNDDMRFVLSAAQYRQFMSREYFYRPVYTSGRKWNFRIYTAYSNVSFFYYDAPRGLKSYRGGHSRSQHAGGYYSHRTQPAGTQRLDIYQGNDYRIVGSHRHQEVGRNDFGANRVQRPATGNARPKRDNYYSNGSQRNRDRDERYHDNSNNQQAPQINHPQQQPQQRPQQQAQPQQPAGQPKSHRR